MLTHLMSFFRDWQAADHPPCQNPEQLRMRVNILSATTPTKTSYTRATLRAPSILRVKRRVRFFDAAEVALHNTHLSLRNN